MHDKEFYRAKFISMKPYIKLSNLEIESKSL